MLQKLGFTRDRRTGEDQYVKDGHPRTVTVPRNKKEVTRGVLSSIWRQAGITKEEAERLR